MKISVNGEIKEFNRECLTLNELLEEMQFGEGIAVALNETFVLRTTYNDTNISDGDRLDILSPVQGG
jgi:sulfur carrier protein